MYFEDATLTEGYWGEYLWATVLHPIKAMLSILEFMKNMAGW